MKLEANKVIMTTPDLQKYYLKRSLVKDDIEYIYLDHGMTSLNLTLRTGALDYFDTIFANGPEQVKEIKEIEELRNTKKKKIIEVGFPLMDDLIEEYNKNKCENKKKTILIAPSHQKDNILESCIDNMLEQLINTEYRIIVRPHPQYIQRKPERIEELKNKYKDKFSDDFKLELDFSSNENVYLADLVITDWSGIGMEYSLATTKPTLYINTKMKVINKDYEKINTKPLDIIIRNKIGKAIEKEETKEIKKVVDELIVNQNKYKQENVKIREKYYNSLSKIFITD